MTSEGMTESQNLQLKWKPENRVKSTNIEKKTEQISKRNYHKRTMTKTFMDKHKLMAFASKMSSEGKSKECQEE